MAATLKLAVLVVLCASSLDGQQLVGPDTGVRLAVTLDQADWRYHAGDTARFTVTLTRRGATLPNARLHIEIGPERFPPFEVDTIAAPSSGLTRTATLDRPGFVGLTARVMIDGRTYSERATAAFDPERIAATTPMPADFMEFWRKAIADARRVPLDVKMTRLADRSTPEVDAYHVSFQNDRLGSRIYGMLTVPTRPGKYPAILTVPGAGVRPYFPDIETARRGIISLRIGIHGIPVDRDSLLYNELRATALKDYWAYRLDDRDSYYYKRVYVGVVRAGDFLFSLPKFDGSNYAVQGGSQGGALSLVAGAIDSRVKGVAVSHPALGDQYAFLHGRSSGWPFMLADTAAMKAKAEKLATIPYYDAVNFARVLRVPGIYSWGYNDLTVPPSSSYAIYNAVAAPKELIIAREAGHFSTPEQARRMQGWIFDLLGARPIRARRTPSASRGRNAASHLSGRP